MAIFIINPIEVQTFFSRMVRAAVTLLGNAVNQALRLMREQDLDVVVGCKFLAQ